MSMKVWLCDDTRHQIKVQSYKDWEDANVSEARRTTDNIFDCSEDYSVVLELLDCEYTTEGERCDEVLETTPDTFQELAVDSCR